MTRRVKEEDSPVYKVLKLRDEGKIVPGSYAQRYLEAALCNEAFWKDSPFKALMRPPPREQHMVSMRNLYRALAVDIAFVITSQHAQPFMNYVTTLVQGVSAFSRCPSNANVTPQQVADQITNPTLPRESQELKFEGFVRALVVYARVGLMFGQEAASHPISLRTLILVDGVIDCVRKKWLAENPNIESYHENVRDLLTARHQSDLIWYINQSWIRLMRTFDAALKERAIKATEVDPTNPLAWAGLGLYYFETQDRAKAEEMYRKAVSVCVADDPARAQNLYEVCYCMIRGSRGNSFNLGELRQCYGEAQAADIIQSPIFGSVVNCQGKTDGAKFLAQLQNSADETMVELGGVAGYKSKADRSAAVDAVAPNRPGMTRHTIDMDLGNRECFFCNNVPPKEMKCSRCKTAVYCNVECQKGHWPEHKKTCVPK